jgi:predicted DNA-binding protein
LAYNEDLTEILKFRVSRELYEKSRARARMLGISWASYIRNCIQADLAQVDDMKLAREIARTAPKPTKAEPDDNEGYTMTSFKPLRARRRW